MPGLETSRFRDAIREIESRKPTSEEELIAIARDVFAEHVPDFQGTIALSEGEPIVIFPGGLAMTLEESDLIDEVMTPEDYVRSYNAELH